MVKKTKSTEASKEQVKERVKKRRINSSNLPARIRDIFFAVWSVVGVIIIVIAGVGALGSGTWSENLNLSNTPQSAQQQAPQPPNQPTKEQLDCVSDELGEKRFLELQQGGQPDEKETAIIEKCLQG